MEFVETLYSWISKRGAPGDQLTGLNNNRLIRVANDINYLFMEMGDDRHESDLSLPQIVVVGTQSSGKSTVLNRIMNLNLLPTGSSMVTRTPLFIRMHHHRVEKSVYVDLGGYGEHGGVDVEMTVEFNYPKPSPDEIELVRNYIARKTNEYAGAGMNISDRPIVIDLYSPDVPNLGLIDLPGLMLIAKKDEGQPEDIKDQIEKTVTRYIDRSKAIILGIMQARSDLETDQGLAFMKRFSESPNRRLLGVLTKPDLMNRDADVGRYLSGEVSSNLQLSEGYFLVCNHPDPKRDPFTNRNDEQAYFKSHRVYSQPDHESRLGIDRLKNHLSQLLLSSICHSLPNVIDEILKLEKMVERTLLEMGEPVPETEDAKLSYLNSYIITLNQRLNSLLEDRGLTISCGKQIKDIFIDFRKSSWSFDPFSPDGAYETTYFRNLIENFDGNHMSFTVPHIEVLECCLTDPERRPVMLLMSHGRDCIDRIEQTLVDTVRLTVNDPALRRYPQLCSLVEDLLVNRLISIQRDKTTIKLKEILELEESYIWSDDPDFKRVMTEVMKRPVTPDDEEFIDVRQLVRGYYQTVTKSFANLVPKIVMKMMVRKLESDTHQLLYDELVTRHRTELLRDEEGIEKKRAHYSNLQHRIATIKQLLREDDSHLI